MTTAAEFQRAGFPPPVDDVELRAAETRVRSRFVDDRCAGDAVHRLDDLLAQEAPLLGGEERGRRAHELAVDLVGLGPIQRLLDDPSVSDVLVNGPGRVWVERGGRVEPTTVIVDERTIARTIERLVGPLGLRADRSNPIVDARLADGTRVAVVLPPLAVDGPVLAVRRHRADTLPLDAFASGAVIGLLVSLVQERLNLVVYGPTGSGKTTLLNALVGHIAPHERIITIEDVAELRLPGDHVVRLESRPGGADGVGRTDLRDLVRVAMRLRPDRIVVGEVRGAEALDMIWALSTGHDGSCSTCHASSPADALRRLETMATLGAVSLPLDAVRSQIHAAVDVLIGVSRGFDGRRVVTAIHELDGNGNLRPLLTAGGVVSPPRTSRRRSAIDAVDAVGTDGGVGTTPPAASPPSMSTGPHGEGRNG